MLMTVIDMHAGLRVSMRTPVVPVVAGLRHSPSECVAISSSEPDVLRSVTVNLTGSDNSDEIEDVALYIADSPRSFNRNACLAISRNCDDGRVVLKPSLKLDTVPEHLWIGVTLRDSVDLGHRVCVKVEEIATDRGIMRFPGRQSGCHRIGSLVHAADSEGVNTARIPGIATAGDGTLLAIFDARRDSPRDLQGDIDIALKRSSDGGRSWEPMQTVLDMGEWGGLADRFNGVSDACILRDPTTNRIFVAGLWMHGMLDENGKWIESLNDTTLYWIHQWKGKGSQPGTGVRQTCQFMIAHSDDNGLSWSEPVNLTESVKRPEWWLFAPAPGQGLAKEDGTLVIPTQGRDENGYPFSKITYSLDHGETWTSSEPAWDNTTECNAVELEDGAVMLNMRDNRNRGHVAPNGRRVCVTNDLGAHWTEHSSSRWMLTEPTCMGSLYRHNYTDGKGKVGSMLLFANPAHHKKRKDMTLKVSFDNGGTWPEAHHILFDETAGKGYSSLTSVDRDNIGILYESGLADLIFIKIPVSDIIKF